MDYLTENLKLGFYILLWLGLLFYYKKHNKGVTTGFVLIVLYTVQAIVALLLYNNPYAVSYPFHKTLSYWPFFYLFLMMVISLSPIITLNERKIKYIEIPNHRIITFLCLFFSIFSVISIIDLIPRLQEGIAVLISSSDDGVLDLYNENTMIRTERKSFSGTYDLIGIISNLSKVLLPPLFFTYLLLKKKSKLVIILLSIALLHSLFSGIASASRLQIFGAIFFWGLLFFFFKPFLSISVRNQIKKYAMILLTVVILSLLSVTIARVNYASKFSDTGLLFNVERYYAEGPLNFNIFCMDANGTREGHIVAPLLLHITGQKSLNLDQIVYKYREMTINNKVFSTYVGDFVLDFGPLYSFIIFVVLFFIFNSFLIYNRGLNYGQVILVSLIVKFCSGFYQFGFGSPNGNFAFVVMILLSALFMTNNSISGRTEIVKRVD